MPQKKKLPGSWLNPGICQPNWYIWISAWFFKTENSKSSYTQAVKSVALLSLHSRTQTFVHQYTQEQKQVLPSKVRVWSSRKYLFNYYGIRIHSLAPISFYIQKPGNNFWWPKFGWPEDHSVTEAMVNNVRFHENSAVHCRVASQWGPLTPKPCPTYTQAWQVPRGTTLTGLQPKTHGATRWKRTWNMPFHSGAKYHTALTFLEHCESALGFTTNRVSLLLRNKGQVLSSFTCKHRHSEKHTHYSTCSFVIVCSFQFRTYPIIYLLSGRPGTGDSNYRKCFCNRRPKANPGADGSSAIGRVCARGGPAGRERLPGKTTQVWSSTTKLLPTTLRGSALYCRKGSENGIGVCMGGWCCWKLLEGTANTCTYKGFGAQRTTQGCHPAVDSRALLRFFTEALAWLI